MKRKTVIYFIVHCFISAIYMLSLSYAYDVPKQAIALHLFIITGFHSLVLILLQFLPQAKTIRYALTVLMGCYWLYLLFLYGSNWIAYTNWGSGILLDFVIHFPQQIWSLGKSQEIPELFMVLAGLLTLVVFWVAAWKLVGMTQMYQLKLTKKEHSYMFLFIAFLVVYLWLTYQRTDPRQWGYEPLMSSVTLNTSSFTGLKNQLEVMSDRVDLERIKSIKGNYQVADTNVVLIIVDALRADKLPEYGYTRATTPFLTSLSNQHALSKVDYFTSTCSESICGIYSILSSRTYSRFGFGILDLKKILKTFGYSVYYILSSNHNYNDLRKLHGEGIDFYVDGTSFEGGITFNDDDGVLQQLDKIPMHQNKPAFFYFHLMSAHVLGKNKAAFNQFTPERELNPKLVGKKIINGLAEHRLKGSNAYDNGVLQTDYYIQQIHQQLTAKGYMKNSLFIVTSDHGDGLGERGYFSHTYHLYHEDINIPFLWSSTEGCEIESTRYGTQIDVAPTVIDCLQLPQPEGWEGVSLLQDTPEQRYTFHQTLRANRQFALIFESSQHLYKLVASMKKNIIIDYELFDYYQDPTETDNLVDDVDHDLLLDLKSKLIQFIKESSL